MGHFIFQESQKIPDKTVSISTVPNLTWVFFLKEGPKYSINIVIKVVSKEEGPKKFEVTNRRGLLFCQVPQIFLVLLTLKQL